MRQRMSKKNVKKYRRKYNLPIKTILVRGGTDHRKVLVLEDDSVLFLLKTGEIKKIEEIEINNFDITNLNFKDSEKVINARNEMISRIRRKYGE